MSTKTIIIIVAAIIFIAAILGLYFYMKNQNEDLKQENMRLAYLSDSLQKIVVLDSVTIKKQATQVKNLEAVLTDMDNVLKDLELNNGQASSYIRVLLHNRLDSIKIRPDTVYKVVTINSNNNNIKDTTLVASGKVDNKYYYIEANWSCNPYELNIIKNVVYNDLRFVEYKNEFGKGVYLKSLNPSSVVDSMNYFVKYEEPEQNRFSLLVGSLLGYNDKVKIYPKVGVRIDRSYFNVDWDIERFFNGDNKVVKPEQFRLGYDYELIK